VHALPPCRSGCADAAWPLIPPGLSTAECARLLPELEQETGVRVDNLVTG
jgi:hypothetical protein